MAIAARHPRPHRRRLGLSLVELLVALTITAMLLTATMVATDASFRAYADAAEQASAQSSTRMVSNRLLGLIRTSTAHGPLEANASTTPPVTISGFTLTSHFIELLDPDNVVVRVEYRADVDELWLIRTGADGVAISQPLVSGVTDAKFYLTRRLNDDGLWVMDRGTMDLTVQPGADVTLQLERGHPTAIRVIASTMPRKLE